MVSDDNGITLSIQLRNVVVGKDNYTLKIAHPHKFGREELDKSRFSYLEIESPLCSIKFQIICKSYSYHRVEEIIQNFDMDAVQCGLYKCGIIQTRACYDAHISRKVTYVINNVKFYRILKILKKGL